MIPFLTWVVAGTGLLLLALTLLIVANKAVREARDILDGRRLAILKPAIVRYSENRAEARIWELLPQPLSRRDARLVERILLEGARLGRSEARDRITAAFESLGCVHTAIQNLRSNRWWRRAEAAEKLGLMGSPAAIDPLVEAMNDDVGEIRIRAARALGIIRGRTSVRPLVRALADPSRWSAIRVAAILINVGSEAVDELLVSYDDLPHHARVSALDILGRIRSLRASSLMRRSLSDPHPDIRSRAAHAMGLIGDPAHTDELIRALVDPEWPVRAMAAKALGRTGASRAIQVLCEAMKDRQWWVRANAGEALRHLGLEGRDALIGMLDTEDTYARHQALAQLEEGRILDEIVADLGVVERIRREAALHCVEKIIAMKRIDHLTQQAIENTQESVRRTLSEILHRGGRLGA
jgi:HEAT repeat protein